MVRCSIRPGLGRNFKMFKFIDANQTSKTGKAPRCKQAKRAGTVASARFEIPTPTHQE